MEMKEKFEKVKKEFEFENIEKIIERLSGELYLTVAEIRIVLEMLEDIANSGKADVEEVAASFISKEEKNPKKKGELFLKKLKKYRYPKMTESMEKLERVVSKIKGNGIKVSYPENLEGNELKIEIVIKGKKGAQRALKKISEVSEEIEAAAEIVRKGE